MTEQEQAPEQQHPVDNPSYQVPGPFNEPSSVSSAPHPAGNPVVDRTADGSQAWTIAEDTANEVTGAGDEDSQAATKPAPAEEQSAE
jgi:hypothetical protein